MCFWTTKWSGAPLLFFANKWISIIICVMQLVQLAPFPSDEVSFFVVYEADLELTKPEVRSVSPKDPLRESLFIPEIRSCSVFQIVTIALVILQFVPWAGEPTI